MPKYLLTAAQRKYVRDNWHHMTDDQLLAALTRLAPEGFFLTLDGLKSYRQANGFGKPNFGIQDFQVPS
jgi:hypothetical protein